MVGEQTFWIKVLGGRRYLRALWLLRQPRRWALALAARVAGSADVAGEGVSGGEGGGASLPSRERLAELLESCEDGIYPDLGPTLRHVLAAASKGDAGLGERLAELRQLRQDLARPGVPPASVVDFPVAVRIAETLEMMEAGDVDAFRRLVEWADGEAWPSVELYWLATRRALRADEDQAERLREVAAIARTVASSAGLDVERTDESTTTTVVV